MRAAMHRRAFLLSPLALAACAVAPEGRVTAPGSRPTRRVAVTMDDPHLEESPRLDPRARDAAILQTLAARGAHAALFVCGMRVDSVEGAALLARWSAAGHSLGNHSYSHRYFHSSKMSVADFASEVDRGDAVLRPHLASAPRRRFRFPFLKEGDTREKRDGARRALAERGYTNGYVTIDASDWAFDARLTRRLGRDPSADVAPLRAAYVAHMLDRARYYDDLARTVLGRPVAHTMLVHHSLLNALFLGDVLDALVADGWTLIDAEAAFADPLSRRAPDVLPAGESLIWSMAKERPDLVAPGALRYPGEDEDYERATLDRLEPPRATETRL